MSCLFIFCLFVDACSHIPVAASEICNSLEVKCGLAFTRFIMFLELLCESFDCCPLLGRVVVMCALHLEMICFTVDGRSWNLLELVL